MLTPEQRHRIEAILEADDPGISPRERIEAAKLLADNPTTDTSAVALAAEFGTLTGEQLDEALAGFFDPGFLGKDRPSPKVFVPDDDRIESRAKELFRQWKDRARDLVTGHPEDETERTQQDAGDPPEDEPGHGADEDVPRALGPQELPPGLTQEDVDLNWPDRHRHRGFMG